MQQQIAAHGSAYIDISIKTSSLQLTLTLVRNLHQSQSIAQNNLATGDLRNKSHLGPTVLVDPRNPRMRKQLVARPHWTSKPRLVLLDVGRITTTQLLQQ